MVSLWKSSTDAGFSTSMLAWRVSWTSLDSGWHPTVQATSPEWLMDVLHLSSLRHEFLGAIFLGHKMNGFISCLILITFSTSPAFSGVPTPSRPISPHLAFQMDPAQSRPGPRRRWLWKCSPIYVSKAGHHCSLCHILSYIVIYKSQKKILIIIYYNVPSKWQYFNHMGLSETRVPSNSDGSSFCFPLSNGHPLEQKTRVFGQTHITLLVIHIPHISIKWVAQPLYAHRSISVKWAVHPCSSHPVRPALHLPSLPAPHRPTAVSGCECPRVPTDCGTDPGP